MKQRILTGIVFGIVVIGLLVFHDYGRLLLLLLIPLLAVLEYVQITKFKIQEILFLFLSIGIISYSCIVFDNQNMKLMLLPCIGVNIFLLWNLYTSPAFYQHKNLKWIFAAVYIIAPFIVAVKIGVHSELKFLLVSILVLIWVADSCAYFVGSQIGKRKLFPSISPGKSWEGLFGGGMCTMIAAYILFSIYGIGSLHFWIGLALIVWVLGVYGDLIASHVKRLLGVKDSGTLLPGHGGFYDRFDAFIYVLPFVLFYYLFNINSL